MAAIDLSKLSDADLQAISKGDMKSVSDEGLAHIVTSSKPEPYTPKEPESIASGFMRNGIEGVKEAIRSQNIPGEKVAGTPAIAIPEEALGQGLLTAARFLGKNAPLRVGTAAGVGAAQGAFAPANDNDERLKNAEKGAVAGGALGTASELASPLITKAIEIGGALPKRAAEIIRDRPDEVNQVIEGTGGALSNAANSIKDKVLESIKDTKLNLSKAINTDLASNNSVIETRPIIDSLEKAKLNLNPHYNSGDRAQIQEMIDNISNASHEGQMDLQTLFETKKYLQTNSQGSFVKNGEIFNSGPEAAKAANSARKIATDTLHKASPDIAHADEIYSSLHDIDDKMSTALLNTDKTENALVSAGGARPGEYSNKDAVQLKRAAEITGYDPTREIENLYAAKQIVSHPSLVRTAIRKVSPFIPNPAPEEMNVVGGASQLPSAFFGSSPSAPSVAQKPNAIQRRMAKEK